MKYCLSSQQPYPLLQKVDEIQVKFKHYMSIPEILKNCPKAKIIVDCADRDTEFKETDWRVIRSFTELGAIALKVADLETAYQAATNQLPFFFGYPIGDFYELEFMRQLGVCAVYLGGDLFFQMDAVATYGIPVRAVPNIANYYKGIVDGIPGFWIRPEDIDLYERYIDVIEFQDCDLEKEKTLYEIYAQDKNWAGPMTYIISNLKTTALNRLILPVVARTRLNCKHACLRGGHCRVCYHALGLANKNKLMDYFEKKFGGSEDGDQGISSEN